MLACTWLCSRLPRRLRLIAPFRYRFALQALFAAVLGPFCFFNAQKTKWLQLFTTVMRWSTFLLMIGIALAGIAKKKVRLRGSGS